MKKGFVYKITWAVLVMFGLFAASCNKDLRVDVKDVKIINEHIDTTTISAKITGEYVFPSVLKGIDVYVSDQENMNNAKVYSAVIENHQFSVEINELVGRTKYFYCYEFNNGMDKACSEVRSFRTAEYADAEIITEVKESSIKATTALVGGVIISTNGYDAVGYGWCWTKNAGLDPDPNAMPHWDTTLLDQPIPIGRLNDKRITGLLPNTHYYVWAYFISSKDYKPVYGQRVDFITKKGEIGFYDISIQQPGLGSARYFYRIDTDFSSPISEHGICWSSTNSDPTPDHCDGKLLGVGNYQDGFSAEMTGLTPGNEYHVRAYATNEIKTWHSEVKDFTSFTGKPVFSGFRVILIRNASAQLFGSVTNGGDNSIVINNWVYCWSKTNSNLDIQHCDGTLQPSSGGYYNMTGLDPEQDYYVRPYVEYNGNQHEHGAVMHFKTTKLGGLTGAFTINDNGDKVCFSQSNLQFKEQKWWLVENQWAYLGTSTGQNSSNQDVDRDLFGWGTSGNNHNDACYQPWSTSPDNTQYWAYHYDYNSLFDGDGTADWGHNRIRVNNSWTATQESDGWRTLTVAEWGKLVQKCYYGGRFSAGSIVVDGVTYHGHFLLPDDWSLPEGLSFVPNKKDWTTNTYTKDQWYDMEARGAVFLPAAGVRYRENGSAAVTDVDLCNRIGYYWSSTGHGSEQARCIVFDLNKENGYETKVVYRVMGYSVRLVHDL